jgi:penicillin-binding protein 1A
MDVRTATIDSVNAIFAQLDLDVGPDAVRQMAYKLGITTHLDGIPAEGIGGLRLGVTPLEQADAYASFADGGVHHPATAVAKVVFPGGKTDEPDAGQSTRVISDGIAYEVTSILKGVITEGTGSPYTDFGCPAAGKTGTSEGLSDAWFVGYTPRLSTAVWSAPDFPSQHRLRRPTAGPILVHGAARLLRRLPAAAGRPVLELVRSHTVSAPAHTFGGHPSAPPSNK